MPDPDIKRRYTNRAGKEEWRCKYCSKSYCTNGGTRIIQNHLQSSHHLEESSSREILLKKRQVSIEDALTQAGESRVTRRRLTTGGNSLNPDIVEVLFVKLTTTGNLPLQLVELPEFRDFLYYLNTDIDSWLPKTHHTVKVWLMRQYEAEKIKIISRINAARTQIHLTLDLWTSPNNLPILGVVAHYISSEKKLEKTTLALRQLTGAYTGSNIAKLLLEVITEFDFALNLGYFQVDNAPNNDTCCTELSLSIYNL
jgi:hypothetical protein